MRLVSMTYAEYEKSDWAGRVLVRAFRRWDAWEVVLDGKPALVLDEYARRRVTVCVYDLLEERVSDIRVLKTLPDAPPGSPAPAGNGGGVPPVASAFLWLPKTPREN